MINLHNPTSATLGSTGVNSALVAAGRAEAKNGAFAYILPDRQIGPPLKGGPERLTSARHLAATRLRA